MSALRTRLRLEASCTVLALSAVALATAPAWAQTAPPETQSGAPAPQTPPATSTDGTPPSAEQQDEGEIVVTGIRQSLASALNAKRDSVQVLDAISAEDIGKFPDKNVGEALQRVTGVQITRAGGEGSGVSIRGADPSLNRVEINGQTALGTGAGTASRSVEFRDIPAEFVSRLEVVKSATPDMTEGGLGGTVRIITRRPFDSKNGYLAGSAQAVHSDLGDRWDPKFAVIGSKLFANNTIGVLASATYEKRSLWYDQARTTGWRQIEETQPATPANQNCLTGRNQANCLDLDNSGFGDFYPDIPRYVINRELTERYAFNGILEWRPSDALRVYAEGTYTRGNQKINSQFLAVGTGQAVSGGGVNTTVTKIGPDQTTSIVRFDLAPGLSAPNGPNVNYRNILGNIDRQTFNTQGGFEWNPSEAWRFAGSASYAKSRAYNNEIDTSATAQGLSSVTIDYSGDQHAPNIILPIDPTTTAGITTFQVLRRPRYNDQREIDFKLSGEYKPEGFLTSIKFGAEKRDLKVTSRYYDATTTYNGYTATPGVGNITAASYTTANAPGSSVAVVQSTGTNAAILSQIQNIVSYSDLGEHDFFNTGDLGFNGITRWLNMGMNVANAAGVPDPFVNPVPTDTWAVNEKNLAGYVSAAFNFSPGGIDVNGLIGARVINTKTSTTGSIVVGPTAATGTTAAQPGRIDPFSSSGEYTEFLPSLNLKADLIPNKVILRGTATEVIARPSPSDLAPRFTLDNVGFTGSRGNPALEPYRARQYDIGAEWYISRTNFVSATLFRKDISSFVDRTTAPEEINGVTYTISRPINGTSKVQINGAEVGGQFTFDFLPGFLQYFGATANYTYSKDKGYNQKDYFTGEALSFPGLSRHSYNLSGFYEDKQFSVRMSYNWRSRYLIAALDRGNNPAYGQAFGQWDASASVTLNDNISLFLEGVNLFHAQRAEDANSAYRINILETYGRRIYGGVRLKL